LGHEILDLHELSRPSDEPRLGQCRSHVAESDHDGTVGLPGVDAPLQLEQVVEGSGGRRVSITRVLPQQPPDDLVEGPRRYDAGLADAAWGLQHLCAEELADVGRVGDGAAREALEDDGADRVEVRSEVDELVADAGLLRGQISSGFDHGARAGRFRSGSWIPQGRVHDPRTPVRGHDDVPWLDGAVDGSTAVQRVQGTEDVDGDPEGSSPRRSVREHLVEGRPFEERTEGPRHARHRLDLGRQDQPGPRGAPFVCRGERAGPRPGQLLDDDGGTARSVRAEPAHDPGSVGDHPVEADPIQDRRDLDGVASHSASPGMPRG
jgi:hypothetical protein